MPLKYSALNSEPALPPQRLQESSALPRDRRPGALTLNILRFLV